MQHALGYGSFRLGTYDARTRCISSFGAKLQCWKGRIVKTGTIYCQCSQGFFPATRESKVLYRTFSRPFGSIPCVASSATTWVNLPNVGGQPTRMYQVRQWACNRHLGYGRTSALQYRLKSSTRVTLLSLSGGAVLRVSIPWQAYMVASLAVEGGK